MILDRLEKDKLDSPKYWGIRLDNAASMAGVQNINLRIYEYTNNVYSNGVYESFQFFFIFRK